MLELMSLDPPGHKCIFRGACSPPVSHLTSCAMFNCQDSDSFGLIIVAVAIFTAHSINTVFEKKVAIMIPNYIARTLEIDRLPNKNTSKEKVKDECSRTVIAQQLKNGS